MTELTKNNRAAAASGARPWFFALLLIVFWSTAGDATEPPGNDSVGSEPVDQSGGAPAVLEHMTVVNLQEIDRQAGADGTDEITIGFDLSNEGAAAVNVTIVAATIDLDASLVVDTSVVALVPGFATESSAGTIVVRQEAASKVSLGELVFLVFGEPQESTGDR